jgi:hypothetical protein
MKVWIVTFILLFAIAELLEWLQQFSLPLPIYILGGALLAIASNYQYRESEVTDTKGFELQDSPKKDLPDLEIIPKDRS